MLKKTLTALALTAVALPTLVQAADLHLTVEGVRSDKGQLMVALYDTERGYMKPNQHVAAIKVRASTGAMRVVFPDLKPGHYAASIFHDEDQNNELNTNLMGVPVEGYGFSQDAKGTFGPASFADAAVPVEGGDKVSSHSTLQY